jgi:hypothetical protein
MSYFATALWDHPPRPIEGGILERTSICVACAYYEIVPASLAVDPACQSKDEADALCAVHRARATEGYCVLCGRREPWVSPWPKSDIGACELCYRVSFGSKTADAVAAELARQRGQAA